MTTRIDIANDDLAGPGHDLTSVEFVATPLPVIGKHGHHARPCGIALAFASVDREDDEEDRFALRLVDQQGEILQQIGIFPETEIVAQWRDCSLKSGLPRMIVREDGSVVPVAPQLGRVALGTSRQRRRHGLLNGRRPRFLIRRKTTRLPMRPTIYRGEKEIIARS